MRSNTTSTETLKHRGHQGLKCAQTRHCACFSGIRRPESCKTSRFHDWEVFQISIFGKVLALSSQELYQWVHSYRTLSLNLFLQDLIVSRVWHHILSQLGAVVGKSCKQRNVSPTLKLSESALLLHQDGSSTLCYIATSSSVHSSLNTTPRAQPLA